MELSVWKPVLRRLVSRHDPLDLSSAGLNASKAASRVRCSTMRVEPATNLLEPIWHCLPICRGIMRELQPLRFQSSPFPGSMLTTVLISVILIAALYFGREVLVPIALAVILSFVLAPAVRLLQRWYLPRGVAVVVVALVAFATISSLAALMVTQLTQFAGELPRYQTTLREKIQSLRGAAAGTGALDRASEVLQDLRKEVERPKGPSPSLGRGEASSPDRPIAVEVRQPDPGVLETLTSLIKPLIYPLTTTGIVFIFVIFVLMQQQDLRNRLVRLAGAQDLQRTTAALDDAGQRLSRLFLTQVSLNAGFGAVIGLGLWMIGVPGAPLWGLLAMIMRFVPYIGAVIAAVLPIVLAAAVGPGWTMVFLTAALFAIVEPVVGHVIEPLVYGQSAGLSPIAVIASATFWTWLWGPVGLVLATPLTLCLVVLGRHVDRLRFLEVMLGDQPPLKPAELLYQRLLARDPVETAEQARIYLKDKPLISYYDDILLAGLKLAQADAERDLLDTERMQHIRDGVAEIVDDLASHVEKSDLRQQEDADAEDSSPLAKLDKVETAQDGKVLSERWRTGKPVLCLPGRGVLDEAATIIIVQLLEREGIGARAEPAGALSISQIFSWDTKDVALICVCYVEDVTAAEIRYALRRVRRRAPDAVIVVAMLAGAGGADGYETFPNADFAQDSLRSVIDKIVAHAQRSAEAPVNGAQIRGQTLGRGGLVRDGDDAPRPEPFSAGALDLASEARMASTPRSERGDASTSQPDAAKVEPPPRQIEPDEPRHAPVQEPVHPRKERANNL